MNDENKSIENADDAWKVLLEIADSSIQARQILRAFQANWKDTIHNVKVLHYENGKPTGYGSEIEGFPSYNFCSELEANFANALFLLCKSNEKPFREEKFRVVFQMVLTLLDIESEWRF